MKIKLFNKSIKLKTLAMIILLIAVLVYAAYGYINLKIQYLEYKEIGDNFVDIFWTNLKIQAIIFIVTFVVTFIVFYITNIFIKRGIKNICERQDSKYVRTPNKSLAVVISLLLAVMFSTTSYQTVLEFLNATWFNISDPIFAKNISYYIFQRPFYIMLVERLTTLLIAVILYTLAYYIVAIGVLMSEGVDKNILKDSSFIGHNFINIILFLIVRAWGFALSVEGLLFSNFLQTEIGDKVTSLAGAGFISVNILRYAYMILPYLIIACILVACITLARRKIKKTVIILAIIPGYLVLTFIVTNFVNLFIVSPNELELERKYIEYNMEYTKKGYNIDIEEEQYNITTDVTQEVVNNNKETIKNTRILDYDSTLKVLNQYQTIKGYYRFNDSDIASYNVNGEEKAVFISARELDQSALKDKNYINKRFQYTHGYGVVVNSVNEIDENGYPQFIIKDIKDNISNGGIYIKEPRIYYGELTDEHVVVNAKNIKEFDYPEGDEEIENYTYTGNSGIQLTFENKLLMAIKNNDPKLIYSQYIDNNSKLLINRNVVERAQAVAPFLEYDKDPYLVITEEGKLVWVIDAYTTTNYYPYSQITQINKTTENGIPYKKEFNYIRNSVKVLVDAYDGTTKFYIVDREDPIVMSYYKMYPTMFENIDAGVPDEIWQHMRYPEYLFNIQSDIIEIYHVKNVDVFYRNEDLWIDSTHNNGTKEVEMPAYYGITTINGQKEFALMKQYTPYNRKNIISWIAVKSNKYEYGKMKLYTFSKDSNIVGPMQLDNQIDQNSEISKDLSLWSSGGSSIIRSMVVVPVGNTLIYVEPIYLAAMNESQIPAIKKIVVSNGTYIAIGNTFEEALNKLVNKDAITITVDNTETIDGIIDTIIQTNKNMKEAAANSNWETYGTYMQKMDDLINQLENMKAKQEEQEQIIPDILSVE